MFTAFAQLAHRRAHTLQREKHHRTRIKVTPTKRKKKDRSSSQEVSNAHTSKDAPHYSGGSHEERRGKWGGEGDYWEVHHTAVAVSVAHSQALQEREDAVEELQKTTDVKRVTMKLLQNHNHVRQRNRGATRTTQPRRCNSHIVHLFSLGQHVRFAKHVYTDTRESLKHISHDKSCAPPPTYA